MKIIDLSMPIAPHFRWPVELSIKGDIASGDQFRVSKIAGPCHGFSHVDAAAHFVAGAPDRLWVADFTYCRTRAGWAYTAFVTDVYARKIVGWKVATEMTQKLVTDAINHAIDTRKRSGATFLDDLIHHSDPRPKTLLPPLNTTALPVGAVLPAGMPPSETLPWAASSRNLIASL